MQPKFDRNAVNADEGAEYWIHQLRLHDQGEQVRDLATEAVLSREQILDIIRICQGGEASD